MGFVQDLRFAVRVLLRKPGFSLVVVLTLALGIGAGSAMFSILHALLIRPVELPGLDRLAMLQSSRQGGQFDEEIPPATFLELRNDARSFTALAAYQYWEVPVSGQGDPEQVIAAQVSPGLLDLLGVQPSLGRWFASDEVDGQKENVVILSHGLWDRRYGRDPAILGKAITVAGASYTVVGVMPPTFHFPPAIELWAPLTLTPEQRRDHQSRYLVAVGKLAPGASVASADAEVRQLLERYAATFPELSKLRMRTVSLVRGITEDVTRNFIYTLFGAALFVLLIACANVANVFLAYALARRKELAVRAALGAGRGRIVRQLLTEAMLLGLAAGLASLLFASWAVDLVKGTMPAALIRFVPGWQTMGIDPAVLLFALGVGLLVGVVFGIVPALQVSRTDVGTVLKDEGRGTTGTRETHRLRNALVVGQVALALTLLLGSGVLVGGFVHMADRGRDLDPHNVLTFRVELPQAREPKPAAEILAFERRAFERLAALPGVLGVATVNNVFWGNNGWGKVAYPEGRIVRPEEEVGVDYRPSTPGYLELLHVPRLEGRGLAESDGEAAPRVAVVSVSAARRLWPNESPIGKRFRWNEKKPWITVVGVVADVQDRNDEDGPRPAIYLPFAQEPMAGMDFVLRTDGPPLAYAHAAQQAIYAVDAQQPVTRVRTLDMVVAERVAGLRIGSGMMGGFAALALVLAAVGIYGVIATLVTQRTHEIGVRMALGAQRGHVLRLVLGKGLLLTAIGILVGLGIGVALVRLLGSVLPPAFFAGGTVVFVVFPVAVAAVAMAGSLLPALRAARLDPLLALRQD